MDSRLKVSGEEGLDRRLVEDSCSRRRKRGSEQQPVRTARDAVSAPYEPSCVPPEPRATCAKDWNSTAGPGIHPSKRANQLIPRAQQPSRQCGARAKVGESGAGRWRTYGSIDLDHSAELRDHDIDATPPARANKRRDAIPAFWPQTLAW